MEITKITTRLQLVSGREMALRLPQKAVMRMEIPAEAIMATTAGGENPGFPGAFPCSGI